MDKLRRNRPTVRPLRVRLIAAVAAPAAVTLLAIPREHPATAVVAVLYVLGVVIAARIGGAAAGIAASLLSSLALNFFFTRPLHTFVVAAPEDLVALAVFLIASVIVGVLLSAAVDAKARAERRELEGRLLSRLATSLLAGEDPEVVLRGFARGLCELFDLGRCAISTEFTDAVTASRGPAPGPSEEVVLTVRGRDVGEIRIWEGRRGIGNDDRDAIESLARQLALALEGVRLSGEVRRAELEVQTSRLKAALFAGVTHDVKTPLASVMAAVTSLIEGREFSEDDRRDHLETIRQEVERLHRVVNNLLDVARLRAGALVASKVPSAIDEVMESVLNRLRPLLGDRRMDIRVADDVPEIEMDVVQIDQVLTNLIENAVKFTPPGSPISLTAVGHPGAVRVTVCDRGPGIPKEDRARIFEPFERGSATTSGTGLGLAIAHAVVVAHGGRMWAADSPGGGAAFTFELPAGTTANAEEVHDGGAGARR